MVYISGAITGTSDYMERFARAEEILTKEGMSVVNPVKVNSMMPKETTYDDYMKLSITMLSCCERIYMLEGWEHSKGANKERDYAMRHGIDVRYFREGERE